MHFQVSAFVSIHTEGNITTETIRGIGAAEPALQLFDVENRSLDVARERLQTAFLGNMPARRECLARGGLGDYERTAIKPMLPNNRVVFGA